MNDHIEVLRAAVARGRCSPENAHKEMDADLAEAVVREVAALAAMGGQGDVHVFNCARCPVSVESRWLEPDCPECGDPCRLDASAKPAPQQPEGREAVAFSVLEIGARGSAYDLPDTRRAFTYEHQPGNLIASRIGGAAYAAEKESAGDSIDKGLGLLMALQEAGFGVFQIGPAITTPPAKVPEELTQAERRALEGQMSNAEYEAGDVEDACPNIYKDEDAYWAWNTYHGLRKLLAAAPEPKESSHDHD